MVLNTYIQKTQRLLHDFSAQFWSQADLTAYINEGRAQAAIEGQGIRVLPPTSGPVGSLTVVNPGTGYTSPTVNILGQGTGASVTANLSGGTIASFTVNTAGNGYFPQGTSAQILDPTGVGATATVNIPNALQTVNGQEVYNFSTINALITKVPSGLPGGGQGTGPGVLQVLGVDGVSISWGQGMKPTVFRFNWSSFQAYLRAYSIGLNGYPSYAAQYGQGTLGSISLWPTPSGAYAMDWDCICLPIPLASDADPEALPYPWTDAIPSYAAHLAFESARQIDKADRMLKKYQWYMNRAGVFSRFGVVPDYYLNS